MQAVPSTLLALVALVLLAIKGPNRGLWVFLATTPFGAAAAFNLPAVGGASILITDLAALMLFALLWVQPDAPGRLVGTMRAFQPGFWMLALVVVCTLSALFFPRLFIGATHVFAVARANNLTSYVSIPLHPTAGNLTQLFRILLDASVFFALATVYRLRPDGRMVLTAVAVATFVNIALGWIDVITSAAGLPTALDYIRTANYSMLTEATMAGLKRMVGGFPEASSFGYYTLGLFGFWLHMWVARGRSRLTSIALILTSIALVRSTSSSAYVAVVLFLVVYFGVSVVRHLGRTAEVRLVGVGVGTVVIALLSLIALAAAYELVQPVTDFLNRTLFDKMASESGVERTNWNNQAWINFIETWGIGAGLGSIRASNWLLACLGSIGAVGTLIFVAFLTSVARAPAPVVHDPERAAVIGALKAGCFAMFVSAMLTMATPDLGVFFFTLAGLATGLSRGAVRESRDTVAGRLGENWRHDGANPIES